MKCPNCGNDDSRYQMEVGVSNAIELSVSSGFHKIELNVCLNCGVCYIDPSSIKNWIDNRP